MRNNYYNCVKKILLENPATRDDDMLLYGAFCATFNLVAPDATFYEIMSTAKKRGLPSYESITRARRRVQELEPYLGGEKRKERQEEAEIYRRYYGGN